MEQMPMWCPPTPPTSDNDVYIDYSLGFLYDNTPMTETQLPPIYVKKEHKRCRLDPNLIERDNRRPVKIRHKEESVFAPRSLFDRQPQALSKMRRDMKLHKYRSMMRTPATMPGVKSSPMIKSGESEHSLDWLIHEDWALLQAIQSYQGLPLNFVIVSPGHTPNWDLVADIVNNTSRIFRSPKQCRSRYESVIVPREEGKLLYDVTPKKQKKQKGIYKLPQVSEQQTKTNRPMRTSQLFNQDKNNTFSSLYSQRFEAIKVVSNKRAPTVKSLLVNPSMKNPKHAELLDEYNIRYENPLAPIDVATRRAERIAKEKMKNANSVMTVEQQAALRLQQQQQLQQQHSSQQTQQIIVTTGSQVFQASTTAAGGIIGNIKAINTIAASTPTIATAAVKARVAGVQSTGIQGAGTPTSTVVTMASLHPHQRIANANLGAAQNTPFVTQKGNIVGVTMSNAGATKLTPAQLQYARQQQQLRQQQQAKNLQQGQAVVSGQKMALAVTATTPQRASFVKQAVATGTVQGVAAGKQATISRPVTENEVAAILKRQGTLQQTKGITQVQVSSQAGMVPAQIYAQAGLQLQQAAGTSTAGSPVATLVKGVRATTPQQIRQLQLQTQLLAQRKIQPGQKVAQLAQITNKAGVPQYVVQQKAIPNMTVQQIHHVMKQVPPGTMQQFTHVSAGQAISQPGQVILAKSPMQQTRVIPVASTGIKQTLQVVTGSTAQIHHTSPSQSNKSLVSTPRASPGPNQMRIQTHIPQQQQQLQQQQQQQLQQQQQQTQGQSNVTETQK